MLSKKQDSATSMSTAAVRPFLLLLSMGFRHSISMQELRYSSLLCAMSSHVCGSLLLHTTFTFTFTFTFSG